MSRSLRRDLVDFYQLNNSQEPVELKVSIGNNHLADSVVRINAEKIKNSEGNSSFHDSFTISLASNQNLIGNNLYITTTILTKPPHGVDTGLKIELSGGIQEKDWKMYASVTEIGDIVRFTAHIMFY